MNKAISFIVTLLVAWGSWNIYSLNNRVKELERDNRAICAALDAHYSDSAECVKKMYEDINKNRFAVRAVANSLKFTEGK